MGSLIAGETNVNCSGTRLLSFAEDGGGDSMGTSLVSFATEDITERGSVDSSVVDSRGEGDLSGLDAMKPGAEVSLFVVEQTRDTIVGLLLLITEL